MANKNINEKLAKLISPEKPKWIEEATWRAENKGWLKRSQLIALMVLDKIEAMKMTQKELSKRVGVSEQHISKILKGRENYTLETIDKLEKALNINLIEIVSNIPTQSSMIMLGVKTPSVHSPYKAAQWDTKTTKISRVKIKKSRLKTGKIINLKGREVTTEFKPSETELYNSNTA